MKNGFNFNQGDVFVQKTEDGEFITIGIESAKWTCSYHKDLLMYKSFDTLFEYDEETVQEDVDTAYGLVLLMFTRTTLLFDEEYLNKEKDIISEYLSRIEERRKGSDVEDAAVVGSFAE